MEAALFATGCLCELSLHFAEIAFEKVVDMTNAMGSSPALKLSAIRVFSKLGASPHLSIQAHEVCACFNHSPPVTCGTGLHHCYAIDFVTEVCSDMDQMSMFLSQMLVW